MILISGMIQAQNKITLSIKDLNSDIEKYIKKNFKEFKAVEAYQYDAYYEMKIQKGEANESLIFDSKGKFLNAKSNAATVQTKTTMALKDVNSDIIKYIKKNKEDYKLTEAYMYDVVYSVKITKGNEAETLLFDKEGKFEKKLTEPAPAGVKEQRKKADSVPAPVKKEEPKKADTTKNNCCCLINNLLQSTDLPRPTGYQ